MYLVKKSVKDFSKKDYNACLSLMSADRKAYIESITNEKTRQISVLAEWLVKTTASRLLNIDIGDIVIERKKSGKPHFKNQELHFNISHSGDFIAVAFDLKPIGIDIEVIREINLAVSKRFCTKDDLDFLYESEKGKTERFFKIWTAKEAYIKCIGGGISDINTFSYRNLSPIHHFEDGCIITIVRGKD